MTLIRKIFGLIKKHSEIAFLFILLLTSLSARVILLDKIPIGIGNDELEYILNAKSLAISGTDLTGTWRPWTLTTPPGVNARGVIPYFLLAPIIGIFPLNLFDARVLYAIIGSLTVLVVYYLAKALFDRKIAFWAGVAICFSPWSIFMSRTAFEAPIALFFYLLGFLGILKLKSWKILLSIIPLFLGFYSYVGMNLAFLPILLVFLVYSGVFIHRREDKKYLFLLAMMGAVILVVYTFIAQQTEVSKRFSELATPQNYTFSEEVNLIRRQSIDSLWNGVFTNKITVYLNFIIGRFANLYSSDLLFVSGDPNGLYGFFRHGLFYFTDVLFLFAGGYFLIKKYKKQAFLIAPLLILAPLPSVISTLDKQYVFRSLFFLPVAILIVGLGAREVWQITGKRKYLQVGLLATLLLEVVFFTHLYFFEMPVAYQSQTAFSSRILANYIYRESKYFSKILVISKEPKAHFKQYLFYNDLINSNSIFEIQKSYDKSEIIFKNVTFATCKEAPHLIQGSEIVAHYLTLCPEIEPNQHNVVIPRIGENGAEFFVYNSQLCAGVEMSPYTHPFIFDDFNVEKMSDKTFCQKFLLKPFKP
jgi:4-amino-4-deoxy-L-arabinose transferase-like glycosyltransferase